MAKHATSREVGKLAGVSVATVSAVINGNKYVSPALQNRVRKAIEALGYQPNLVARSLKLKETKSIGLIFTNISSPFWPPMVRTVQKAAQKLGYDTILIITDEDLHREKKSLSNLLSKRVDGILITPALSNDYEHIRMAARSIPVIAIEREIPGIESVITNNEETVYQAVNHLIDHGYTKIGVITIPVVGASTAHRIDGYKRALTERGLYSTEFIREVDFAGKRAREAALNLLSETDIEAIITTSESTTLGTLQASQQLGRRIPDDLGLFGFDDVSWMRVVKPPISTIRQPIEQMARLATNRLFDYISGKNPEERIHILRSSPIIRCSCGCRVSGERGIIGE
jgi:LacI family transcriptional regulator